jgi:hypothetical protein
VPEPGAIGNIFDLETKGMWFDPHSGNSKVKPFSLAILTDKIVLVFKCLKSKVRICFALI